MEDELISCPCCERSFDGFRDFPRMRVLDFKREDVGLVGSGDYKLYREKWRPFSRVTKIPKKIATLLHQSGKTTQVVDGNIYQIIEDPHHKLRRRERGYLVQKDITGEFNELLSHPLVKNKFSALESLQGMEIETKDFFDLLLFNPYNFGQPHGRVRLNLSEQKMRDVGEPPSVKLYLLSESITPFFGNLGGAHVASLHYEGLVNKCP